jgi:two-component system, response regulator RegA
MLATFIAPKSALPSGMPILRLAGLGCDTEDFFMTDFEETTAAPRSQSPARSFERSTLIVDDDRPFAQRLARAMESRGFAVETAESVVEAMHMIARSAPAFAIVDLRLQDGSGLDVISSLVQHRPDARAIVLTGYGNIASAVGAIKCGAADYLAKPADTDEILAALFARGGDPAPVPENPMSANRVRWEHIQRIFELCNRNVSQTARRLGMHRRTLQRILAKRAPD